MLSISLSTALISFVAFGSISFFYMKDIYEKTISIGEKMGKLIAKFTEDFAVKQAKERLFTLAVEKSKRIERGMSDVKNDAEAIAYQMQQILSRPEKFKPINIPNHEDKPIYSGEAYVHYAPKEVKNALSDELKNEVAITSNIADILRIKANFYKGHQTSTYIGSSKPTPVILK